MSECPPPPPPPVEIPAAAPAVSVPVPTLQWLAARDLHAERVTACYLQATAARELALGDAATLRAQLEVAERRADGWERAARRRPSWGLVVGGVVAGVAVGVVGWETVR